jgi:hypothetical protein
MTTTFSLRLFANFILLVLSMGALGSSAAEQLGYPGWIGGGMLGVAGAIIAPAFMVEDKKK